MTTHTTSVDHASRRLVVALPQTYDEARERYESLVPDVDFVRFAETTSWRTTQCLMGNHTIAERMFRHDPSVMLHAPLRTVLYADADGVTKLGVDQPSLLFDSYGKPEMSAVGRELDGLLAGLLSLPGGQTPSHLGS